MVKIKVIWSLDVTEFENELSKFLNHLFTDRSVIDYKVTYSHFASGPKYYEVHYTATIEYTVN